MRCRGRACRFLRVELRYRGRRYKPSDDELGNDSKRPKPLWTIQGWCGTSVHVGGPDQQKHNEKHPIWSESDPEQSFGWELSCKRPSYHYLDHRSEIRPVRI